MAFCANCGTQLEEGVKFCPSCGTPAGGNGTAPVVPVPAVEKAGNIRKCPACGAEVPAMVAVCPSCGHEFSGVKVANSVQEFFTKLQEFDEQTYRKDSQRDIKTTVLKGVAKFYGASALVPDADDRRKREFIEGFPIPNTKEDIMEFIILASSKFSLGKSGGFASLTGGFGGMAEQKKWNDIWAAKCKQAYVKAQIAFGSDKDGIQKIEKILKEAKIKL